MRFLFERLKKNYHNDSRFIFENVAIGKEEKATPFYYVAEDAKEKLGSELPYWYDQLGSFDRGHILKHLDGKLEPYIVEEEVVCLPLLNVFGRNNVHSIDLFHVDAKGFDFHILSQLPFERLKPSVILYERNHLSAEEQEKAQTLLVAHGYTLANYGTDTLATLADTAQPSFSVPKSDSPKILQNRSRTDFTLSE